MAIFIPGIPCILSGRPILSPADAVMFSPFVSNPADPLFIFHDAVVHKDVFREHPLAAAALARHDEVVRERAPEKRVCGVCGKTIFEPDDFLPFEFLTDDTTLAAHAYNYKKFHRSCFRGWDGAEPIIDALDELARSGTWGGDGLSRLVAALSNERRR